MSEPTTRMTVTESVERGADAAEELHKAIAHIPLDAMARVRELEGVVDEVRDVQDRTLGAVYDLVRGVNREVGKLADEILEVAASSRREAKSRLHPRPVEDRDKQA